MSMISLKITLIIGFLLLPLEIAFGKSGSQIQFQVPEYITKFDTSQVCDNLFQAACDNNSKQKLPFQGKVAEIYDDMTKIYQNGIRKAIDQMNPATLRELVTKLGEQSGLTLDKKINSDQTILEHFFHLQSSGGLFESSVSKKCPVQSGPSYNSPTSGTSNYVNGSPDRTNYVSGGSDQSNLYSNGVVGPSSTLQMPPSDETVAIAIANLCKTNFKYCFDQSKVYCNSPFVKTQPDFCKNLWETQNLVDFISRNINEKTMQNAISADLKVLTKSFAETLGGQHLPSQCVVLNSLITKTSSELEKNIIDVITHSKPYYDTVLTEVNKEIDYNATFQLFKVAKDEIETMIPAEAKKHRTKNDLKHLTFSPLKSLPLTLFQREPNTGLLIIKGNDSQLNLGMSESQFYFNEMKDPNSLTEFNSQNQPASRSGRTESRESIIGFPGFLVSYKDNPYGEFFVLAHEVAHNLGAFRLAIDKSEKKPAWSHLLDCYAKTNSIAMSEGQKEEVLADHLATNGLVEQIEPLSIEQKKQAVMAAVQFMCMAPVVQMPNMPPEPHPDNLSRINGIIMSNPRLRKSLGCSTSSKYFSSCDVQGEVASPSAQSTR